MSDENRKDFYESLTDSGGLYTSLELTRNTKGYNWTVKCAGFDTEEVKAKIQEMNNFMQENYGG